MDDRPDTSRLRGWLEPLALLSQNNVGRAGVVLATAAVIFWLFLLPAGFTHPYVGIITAAILPAVLLVGLFLIPLGFWIEKRKGTVARTPDWPRFVMFLAVTTSINVVIGALSTHKALSYMDSVGFCGSACHTVMSPHFAAHQRSIHRQVACVQCHVGPGAQAFVAAKLNGMNQLFEIVTSNYPRPVPPGLKHSKSSAQTCEGCHARASRSEDRLKVIRHFSDDKASTPKTTVLMMKTAKIHQAHPKEDCMTCHNRAGHSFALAEDEVDSALAAGRIDRALPFARKRAVETLQSAKSADDAASKFPEAGAAIKSIYEKNVFPGMKIVWGSYPDNLGHTNAPGCFRCHDGSTRTQDCAACHTVVAMEEESPKILSELSPR